MEDWLGAACGAISTCVLIPTGQDHQQLIAQVFSADAFIRTLYLMATKEDGNPHPCHNSIVLTLAHIVRMGYSKLNQEETMTLLGQLS